MKLMKKKRNNIEKLLISSLCLLIRCLLNQQEMWINLFIAPSVNGQEELQRDVQKDQFSQWPNIKTI